ncbi:MAG: glycosyltransferase family 39 protein [Eudoraea sp.]|uniref:glycosyltransferase family 39 protein n=1 Tax=Eudoraea sp. TaxID=1979955 RepID=UPI003C74F013
MTVNKLKFWVTSTGLMILILALLKFIVHAVTFDNYELHRDAYLYYALSEHLAWGYVAVPPSIAVIGKVATTLFGNTVFGLRFFPFLIGAINVIIIGMFTRDLGGKKIAIALACLAYIFSPAYLHVNTLFQPVAFNHFFWLLSGYLFYKLISIGDPKMWLWIGIVFGLGFLNKYSIVFLYTSFGLSMLFSRYRKLYLSHYFVYAILIALFIISPNLYWQYGNNWPVLQHMEELRRTQLVHVQPLGFIVEQLLMNAQALFLWIGALLILLFNKKERQYRIFAYVYLLVFVLLLAGSGKPYYTLGIYPILFVFGGYFTQKYIVRYLKPVFVTLVASMALGLYFSMPFDGIPFISFEKALNKGAFRWEDGEQHDLPQDMADMTGWKAIGEAVSAIYLDLGEENRDNCHIYCYHYGQAGAIMFYGKKHNISQPISPNASFVFWSPDNISKDYVIYVHSDLGNTVNPDSLLPTYFEEVELKKVINDPYFRENGTRIYLCHSPNEKVKKRYLDMMKSLKERYR